MNALPKTFKIATPRGLEIFVTLTPNDDGRLLMQADIPDRQMRGNFLSCNRMPKPKNGATHFIEINYRTAVGLDEFNASLLKAEIDAMKSTMEQESMATRKRKRL